MMIDDAAAADDSHMSSESEDVFGSGGSDACAMEDDLVIDKNDKCDEYKDVLLQAGKPSVCDGVTSTGLCAY